MATTTLEGIERTFRKWGVHLDTSDMVPGHPRGAFVPEYVMIHHDAGRAGVPAPSHRIIREGRPTVPPPLYQLYVRRDLKVELVSYGRANHAGEGGPWRDLGVNEGNRRSVGICVAHTGYLEGKHAEPWDSAVVRRLYLVTAVVCDFLGIDADRVLAHKEYTDRKPDPLLHMGLFRTEVGDILTDGPPTTPREGDDMTPPELLELLTETKVKLGPKNAELLRQPDGDISLAELLVTIAGRGAEQSRLLGATLEEARDQGERLDRFLEAFSGTDDPAAARPTAQAPVRPADAPDGV
jgi:hypothetical protein